MANDRLGEMATARRLPRGVQSAVQSAGPLTRLLTALMIAFVASGCVAASPEVGSGDPVLVQGRDIYARNCASCHGSAGQGGRGTRLNGGAVLEAFPDPADQAEVIVNGRNQMPAFTGKFTTEEIDAVVRYTREVLNTDG